MTTKQKKLKKLAEKYAIGPPPSGDEFTVAEWSAASGMSGSHANKELGKMVAAGVLKKRTGRINGKSGNIYDYV